MSGWPLTSCLRIGKSARSFDQSGLAVGAAAEEGQVFIGGDRRLNRGRDSRSPLERVLQNPVHADFESRQQFGGGLFLAGIAAKEFEEFLLVQPPDFDVFLIRVD